MDTVKLPPLVGLYSDFMGSGKSEVAKVLVEEYGFALVKFAGPLKEMTRVFLRLYGLTDQTIERMIDGDLKETVIEGLGVTPRHLMQTLGTEWGRELVHSDVWVKLAVQEAETHRKAGRPVVIDDMRFPNEQAAILAKDNASDVWIYRPDLKPEVIHGSEGLLSGISMKHFIDNKGSLEDLKDKARDLAKDLGVEPKPRQLSLGFDMPHGFDPFKGEY